MGATLAELTAEIREINVAHGFRPAEGGPGGNTWGDYISLLHTEPAEATEVYRDHKLADVTRITCGAHAATGIPCKQHGPPKPEGVGSELADTVIRLLDMGDVFGYPAFEMDLELADISPFNPVAVAMRGGLVSFGDWVTLIHRRIALLGGCPVTTHARAYQSGLLLRELVAMAAHYGFDLPAEVARKIAYNRTRPYQHGGRTLVDQPGSA
jgi:hypothetical protein